MVIQMEIPSSAPPYPAAIFAPMSKIVISLMCQVLGYKNDMFLDEILLGFLVVVIPPDESPF